jgi:hypothetical protein
MSPRHGPLPPKSFAQHLLEIEREAARAARRVRGANARASLSFADPPFSSGAVLPSVQLQQSTAADARLAEADEVRRRAACEILVLRLALPDVEAQLDSCAALLHASVRREQHASQRAAQLSEALRASQAAEARLAAEVQQLRLANDALTHRVADLQRSAPVAPPAMASRLPASGLIARGVCAAAPPAAAQHAARLARPSPAAAGYAPPARASAPARAPRPVTPARGAPHSLARGGQPARALPAQTEIVRVTPAQTESVRVLPEQAEIVQASVALATLEVALSGGSGAHDAGLAAASAEGAQMALAPPQDNDRRVAWVGYAQAVHRAPASHATVTAALASAPTWVKAVTGAADSFVGGSLPQIESHLRGVVRDATAAAVRELQARAAADGGAGVGHSAAAEAGARVNAVLRAAIASVQQQLTQGLVNAVRADPAAAACPAPLLGRMCVRAVAATCEPLAMLTSEAEISAHILEEVAVARAVAAAMARPGGAQAWLREFVLGREGAPVAEETEAFIATQARHDFRLSGGLSICLAIAASQTPLALSHALTTTAEPLPCSARLVPMFFPSATSLPA